MKWANDIYYINTVGTALLCLKPVIPTWEILCVVRVTGRDLFRIFQLCCIIKAASVP